MSRDFTYSNTVRGIVERLTYQLNDAESGWENQQWSAQWLTARVLDTFKWFQDLDPSLFAEEVIIELKSGAKQELPEECEKLIDFDCYLDAKGRDLPVFEADYNDLKASTVYNKLMDSCFYQGCTMSAAMHPNNPRSFLVDPPVGPGKIVKMRVVCSSVQNFFDDIDTAIECDFAKYITAVVEWVMYEALAMDGLNPTTLAIANTHRENFFGLVPQMQNFMDRGMRSDSN